MCVKREKKRNDRIKEEDGKSNHRPKRTEVFSFKVHFFELAFSLHLGTALLFLLLFLLQFLHLLTSACYAFGLVSLCTFFLFALKVEYSKHSKLNHI